MSWNERLRNSADRIHFEMGDLEDPSIPPITMPLDFVVSVLTIHHLDDAQKVLLFRRIYDSLRDDGIFIYCDMFRPNSSCGWSIAAEEWPIEVAEQGKRYAIEGAEEVFQRLKWNYYLDPKADPSDKPASIFDTLRWLNTVGFSDVDLHWHSAGHGLLSARKIGGGGHG